MAIAMAAGGKPAPTAIQRNEYFDTDDKALEVFEQLAENPKCDMRWIQNLAMIYIVRQRWGKLKLLAEKIEQRSK